MNLILIAVVAILSAILFYKWGTKNYDYFTKKGIPFSKPTFLVGSSGGFIMRKYSLPTYLVMHYEQFSQHK